MTNANLDKLTWVLIYGGLLLLCLALFVLRAHEPLGWTLVVAGAVITGAGVFSVWVRSRRATTPSQASILGSS